MKKNYETEITIVDQKQIKNFIQSISSAKPDTNELKVALSLIDLTTLEGNDTDEKVIQLCNKAIQSDVAAVCVYPVFASVAKKQIKNTSIKIACVAGAFPSGQMPLDLRLKEAEFAIAQGADEIDMVISRGKLLEKNYDYIFNEVQQFKKVCGDKKLKVILETGELQSIQNIHLASVIAIDAGADFIKTSTGKISVNATLEAVCVMLIAIKNHFDNTGKKVGIKPSGGISDGATAVGYLRLTEKILGKEWLSPSLFRFGASRLVDNLIAEINNQTYIDNKSGY